MLVLIRADSSTDIGAGHIMRCLSLAVELRKRDIDIIFVSRDLEGNILNYVKKLEFPIKILPVHDGVCDQVRSHFDWENDAKKTIEAANGKKIDLCIVDNYKIDYRWHDLLSDNARKVFVIDDMPNRKFACDILLDQTYGRDEKDYIGITPANCKLLLGTNYALLRSEFRELRPAVLNRRKKFAEKMNIMISMGGMDIDNYTSIILGVIDSFSWKVYPQITIALNSSSPHLEAIENIINNMKIDVKLHVDTRSMAQLMLEADLAIGGGGTTSWERCCLGLPAIAIITADNQRQIVSNLEDAGAIIKIDVIKDDLVKKLNDILFDISNNKQKLFQLSKNSMNICDGIGVEKSADIICSELI